MDTILITPKTEQEFSFLLDLLQRMHIKTSLLTEEDKEDAGLLKMMEEADRNDVVSEEEIMQILN